MPLLLLPLVFCGAHSFHFHALEYVFPAQTFLAHVAKMLLSCSWAHASVTAEETPLMVGVADNGKIRRLKWRKKATNFHDTAGDVSLCLLVSQIIALKDN